MIVAHTLIEVRGGVTVTCIQGLNLRMRVIKVSLSLCFFLRVLLCDHFYFTIRLITMVGVIIACWLIC